MTRWGSNQDVRINALPSRTQVSPCKATAHVIHNASPKATRIAIWSDQSPHLTIPNPTGLDKRLEDLCVDNLRGLISPRVTNRRTGVPRLQPVLGFVQALFQGPCAMRMRPRDKPKMVLQSRQNHQSARKWRWRLRSPTSRDRGQFKGDLGVGPHGVGTRQRSQHEGKGESNRKQCRPSVETIPVLFRQYQQFRPAMRECKDHAQYGSIVANPKKPCRPRGRITDSS